MNSRKSSRAALANSSFAGSPAKLNSSAVDKFINRQKRAREISKTKAIYEEKLRSGANINHQKIKV